MATRTLPDRLHYLDTLRGVAALAIVVFHYHHFFLRDAGDRPNMPPVHEFPWGDVLPFLYGEHAAAAVQLFWMISGVVFTHVYMQRATGAWPFFVARFARLYPLHFATLLLVAGLQWLSLHYAGHWQIYGNNDLKHFILQLLFASHSVTWSHGLSFNGPIWSVSLEIPIYFYFLVTLPLHRRFPMALCLATTLVFAGISAASGLRIPVISKGIFGCGAYFFLGATLYHLYAPRADKTRSAVTLLLLGILGALAGHYFDAYAVTVAGVSFALLTLFLHADQLQLRRTRLGEALGDMSYSVYLVHVPLQMLVLLIADLFFDGTRAFAAAPWVLPIYLGTSMLVAHAAYRYFERPAGAALRRQLNRLGDLPAQSRRAKAATGEASVET